MIDSQRITWFICPCSSGGFPGTGTILILLDSPGANELIVQDMGKVDEYQNTTKREPCAYIWRHTLWNTGFLFTKRADVLPQDLVKSQSHEIRV